MLTRELVIAAPWPPVNGSTRCRPRAGTNGVPDVFLLDYDYVDAWRIFQDMFDEVMAGSIKRLVLWPKREDMNTVFYANALAWTQPDEREDAARRLIAELARDAASEHYLLFARERSRLNGRTNRKQRKRDRATLNKKLSARSQVFNPLIMRELFQEPIDLEALKVAEPFERVYLEARSHLNQP